MSYTIVTHFARCVYVCVCVWIKVGAMNTHTHMHPHMHTHNTHIFSSSSVLIVLKDVGQDLGQYVTVAFQWLVDEHSPPCAVLYHCLSVRQAGLA